MARHKTEGGVRYASPKQMEVRERFAAAAHECSQQVKGLPKGQRLKAYRECIAAKLRTK